MVYKNVCVECYREIYSAAYYGDYVELYPECGYITITINVDNRDKAKLIFEEHNIPWPYNP